MQGATLDGAEFRYQRITCNKLQTTDEKSESKRKIACNCKPSFRILNSCCTLLLLFPFPFPTMSFSKSTVEINHANGICTIEYVNREFSKLKFVLSSNRTNLKLCQKLSRGAYLNIRIVLIRDETSYILIWLMLEQHLEQFRHQLQP